MTAPSYTHMFSEPASRYAENRPTYPPELYERLYTFCDFKETPELAVDVATGSGQAAADLARKFKRVVALDSDEAQLKGAKQAPANVEFRVGLAEEMGLPSSSADLVSSAAALHWFDHARHWAEAARVLKPGGTVAAWCYNLGSFVGNPAATKAMLEFYHDEENPISRYWTPRRKLVDEEYGSLVPDPALFGPTHRDVVTTTTKTTIAKTAGFVSTWSAYGKFRQAEPDTPDPLVPLKQKLKAAFGTDSEDHEFELEWRVYILMAKKK